MIDLDKIKRDDWHLAPRAIRDDLWRRKHIKECPELEFFYKADTGLSPEYKFKSVKAEINKKVYPSHDKEIKKVYEVVITFEITNAEPISTILAIAESTYDTDNNPCSMIIRLIGERLYADGCYKDGRAQFYTEQALTEMFKSAHNCTSSLKSYTMEVMPI